MTRRTLALVAASGLAFASASTYAAPIAINAFATAVTENFDSLANTGTSSTVPAGWAFVETGSAFNTTYTAGTGSATAGDTYSFGATATTERAFGTLLSGSLVSTIGASFTNSVANGTITSLAISYHGEEWRLGAQNRLDRLDFQYSLDATSLTTGTWVDVDTLDFSTPNQGAAVGALDGNLAANSTTVSSTISSLSIASGATFWIRYTDLNATGADDGLAVDDFSLTATGTTAISPEPTTLAALFGAGSVMLRRRK